MGAAVPHCAAFLSCPYMSGDLSAQKVVCLVCGRSNGAFRTFQELHYSNWVQTLFLKR